MESSVKGKPPNTTPHSFLFLLIQQEVENLKVLQLQKSKREFPGRSSATRCKRGGCARGGQKGKTKGRGFLSFAAREK